MEVGETLYCKATPKATSQDNGATSWSHHRAEVILWLNPYSSVPARRKEKATYSGDRQVDHLEGPEQKPVPSNWN